MRLLALICILLITVAVPAATMNVTTANVSSLVYQAPPAAPSAPVISLISTNTPGTNYANITWTTDLTTTNDYVYFDASATYLWASNNTVGGTSHSIWLSNLVATTTYNFEVVSWATNGLSTTSAPSLFVTATPGLAIPYNLTFTNMGLLTGTNWASDGTYATNNPTFTGEMLIATNFANTSLWKYSASFTFHDNSAWYTNLSDAESGINSTNNVNSGTLAPIRLRRWDWYRYGIGVTNWGGHIYMAQANPGPDKTLLNAPYLATHSAGTFSGTFPYQANVSEFIYKGISSPDTASTGVVSYVSLKHPAHAQLFATVDSGISNHSVTVQIESIPTNQSAGLVIRHSFENYAAVIGDSKMQPDKEWVEDVNPPIRAYRLSGSTGGLSMTGIYQDYTNQVQYEVDRPDIAVIDAGANNADGTEADKWICLSNFVYLVEDLSNRYPAIKCYLANIWRTDFTTTNANWCIDTTISWHSNYCYHGIDERIGFSNDWAGSKLWSNDGIHWNTAAGFIECAKEWNAVIGTGNPVQAGLSSCIYVYYDNSNQRVKIVQAPGGTNTWVQSTPVSFVTNASLTASIYTNMLKVFYNGSLVGTTNFILNTTNLNGTHVGLFCPEAGPRFSAFSISNSTDSVSAP